jgi:hypothetical protein
MGNIKFLTSIFIVKIDYSALNLKLKGQSHEKVCEIMYDLGCLFWSKLRFANSF